MYDCIDICLQLPLLHSAIYHITYCWYESSLTMEDIGLKAIWKGSVFIYKGLRGSDCKRLQQIVNNLLPIVGEICESSSESSSKLSLQKFKEFRDNLVEVNQLVAEHKTTRSLLLKIQINDRVKKVEKSINEFIQNDLQIVMARVQDHLSTQLETVRALQDDMLNAQVHLSTQLEIMNEGMETVRERVDAVHKAVVTLSETVETGVQSMGKAVENEAQTLVETVHQELQNFMSKFEEQQIERLRQAENLCKSPDFCSPPGTPSGFLGFNKHIMELKKILLEDGVNVVGVTAMGGAGKSTLAAAVCNHAEITEYFKETVIYIEVSESPDLLTILKTVWKKILGGTAPDFTNVLNAHKELQSQIKSRNQPILVVLDDIWSTVHLEKLLFEGKQYKTLITTRDTELITNGLNTRIYKLSLLQPEHALSLFCHYAFDRSFIPIGRDKQLVEKVQQECKGLPLALKVIGSSLYGKSDCDWERAEKGLSAGGTFNDDHKQSLLNKLKTSIDVLNDNERECFLDMGAFPQKKAIPAKALLDIWVYVRGMKSGQAKMLLGKFADRHLLDLKKNTGTSEITDDSMDGYSVSQHDIMRDLALYLANQANSRRLYMPKMKNHLPSEWEKLSSKAHIVSIHTGAMEDSDWPRMEFPKVKALVLYFTASEYCIPTFLHTMKNLKVLIIHNTDGAKRSKLSGVAGFQELSQLKSLHLERLIVTDECKVLKSLEKIYISLCEGLDRNETFNFPGLLEFNVSYCIDLEELPARLCSSVSLKRLSVTHCHCLAKLPDEMASLESLKQIKLFESPSLKALPSSICNLKNLKFLDISSCISLNVNGRERCELKETLQTVAKLPSLKLVICDEKNEKLFKMTSRTDLKVQAVVEQEPNLDWLDLEIWNERN